jgi:hypothetical protein
MSVTGLLRPAMRLLLRDERDVSEAVGAGWSVNTKKSGSPPAGWLTMPAPGWLSMGDPAWLRMDDPGWLSLPDPGGSL